MKVSIITVTYNSIDTLRDTIESVIEQDYPDIEHIIVDGSSNDGTQKLVKSYGAHISQFVSEPDKGIYDAMNKGIRMATGTIVGILNSDDFFTRTDVVSKVVEAFESDRDLDAVHGDLYYVDEHDTNKIIRYWHMSEYKQGAFFRGWHPAHPTLYLRKEVYTKYGLYDLRFPLSADFELMLRLFECCRIKTRHLNIVMIRMRIGGATSKSLKSIWRGIGQCKRAFRANGLRPPIFYPILRFLPKLWQFVDRSK